MDGWVDRWKGERVREVRRKGMRREGRRGRRGRERRKETNKKGMKEEIYEKVFYLVNN